MTTLTLPDLGEGLQEAEIVSWHVAVGDQVVVDQPLLSVETDKAVVEIPSPQAGRVAKLHAEPGAVVPIGAPLVDFDAEKAADSGGIVGALARDAEAAVLSRRKTAKPAPAQAGVRAAPAVRALARELGVDLATVTGSGPGGALARRDVEQAARRDRRFEGGEKLRGVRRAMARNMTLSHREVVPATVNEEVDIDDWPEGSDISIRMIQAIAAGCAAAPALNAWYDSASETRRLMDRVDLGIAVHTDDGLFVPVMRDVGRRDAADLRRGLEALKRDVRARSIPPEELRDATITLSNFGVFRAGLHAALVVSPPQVAIVGAGRICQRPAAGPDGRLVMRRVLPLSLTFDHRVVNGGEGSAFFAAMIASLGRPA